MAKSKNAADTPKENPYREFLIGLARAFAGAIIFSFSIVMTSEMWWLGFTMERHRLAIFILLSIPTLILLAYFIGFKKSANLKDAAVSAFVASCVGYFTAALLLFIFGVIDFGMSLNEVLGKITLQGFTATFGALFAQSQLGTRDDEKNKDAEKGEERERSYLAEIFLMSVGAVFLAMNPAATIEMPLLSYKMVLWQFVAVAVLTLFLMHGFVYSFKFRGQSGRIPENANFWRLFFQYTVVGYAVALTVAAYSLWAFGSFDGLSITQMIKVTLVLGFPAGLGAAASRIIL